MGESPRISITGELFDAVMNTLGAMPANQVMNLILALRDDVEVLDAPALKAVDEA